jgi:membrane protein
MRNPRLVKLLKATFTGWHQEGALLISAALAYFAVFSIAPLLVIVTFVAGLVHRGNTMEQVRAQFSGFVSPESAELIARAVVNAGSQEGRGIGYTIFALMVMIVGTSAFTHELQSAVDIMWKATSQRKRGVFRSIGRRLWTLLFAIGAGVFLQMFVVVNAATSAYRRHFDALLPGMQNVWQGVDFAVSLAAIAFVYSLSYKFLPSAKVAWRDAFAGALVATLLFSAGKWIVALYVFPANFTSVYGAAGSLMVLLVWLYYCSLVFLFGAKFTHACGEVW